MKILKNAVVMPHVGNMDNFTEGVFTENGDFIQDSTVKRGMRPQLCEPAQFLEDTCIYGGTLYGHFGHFIWESLSRLSTIRKCKDLPIIFLSPNLEIHNSQKMFLKKIGVRNRLYLIKVPVRVKNLVYSSPHSAVDPVFMTDEQIASFSCMDFNGNTERKIWLSRSRLPYGKVLNESQLEHILKIMGFEIYYPEDMPLHEQVRLISTAKIIAGFDGSQFFSALFANKIDGKFFIFNRRPHIASTIPYIFSRKNIDFRLFNFNLKLVDDNPNPAGSNYISLDIDKIVNELKY